MLESHNDTAVVLGEYIGGKLLGETGEISEHTGEESKAALHRFAQAMNKRRKRSAAKILGSSHQTGWMPRRL